MGTLGLPGPAPSCRQPISSRYQGPIPGFYRRVLVVPATGISSSLRDWLCTAGACGRRSLPRGHHVEERLAAKLHVWRSCVRGDFRAPPPLELIECVALALVVISSGQWSSSD